MSREATTQRGQQAVSPDPAAVEALLLQHLPVLRTFVRSHADPLICRQESVADVTQSVCREVLEARAAFEYRGEPAFRKWLFTVAERKLVSRKRHYLAERRDVRRVDRALDTNGNTETGLLDEHACSPSDGVIARETDHRLRQAFDHLSKDSRTVITLSRLLGMSHAEIAALMGRREGAVRTLLCRALARVRRALAIPNTQAESHASDA